jgi:hypothetical protein
MEAIRCPACHKELPDVAAASCPYCGATLPGAAAVAAGALEPPPPLLPAAGSSIPFEDRSRPFAERLWATVKLAFADPARLFSNVPDSDIGPPLVYALVVQTISVLFATVWQIAILWCATLIDDNRLADLAVGTGVLTVFLILSPLFVLVSLFVGAGLYHLMLLLVGDGRRGFAVTLRAQAYGATPNLLGIVPVCGWLAGGVWVMVVTILGAYYGHRTDAWRAALAYFLPVITCCCLTIWIVTSLGFLGFLGD